MAKDKTMSEEKMQDDAMMNEEKTMDKMSDDMDEEKHMDMDDSKDEMMDDSKDDMMEDVVMNDGKKAPDFTLMSLNGEEVSLSALKGDKVYLKFWASWCSICLSGLDELEELAMTEDFMVYTIVAPGERGEKSKKEFTEWFESLGYEHIEVLFDEDGDVQKDYQVRGFPTSSYIGSDGILVKTIPGHMNNNKVFESFESIK
jgi:peroxiredoxin